jgi:hypothetical protein
MTWPIPAWKRPTAARTPSAGSYCPSPLSDEELAAAAEKPVHVHYALGFLLRHAAKRMPAVARPFLHITIGKARCLSSYSCRLLLSADARTYEGPIAQTLAKEREPSARAEALGELAVHFPDKYLTLAREANLAILADPKDGTDGQYACHRLAKAFGASVVPEIGVRLAQRKCPADWACRSLAALVEDLGEAAAPAVVAVAQDSNHEVRLAAIGHLLQWPRLKHDAWIQSVVAEGLTCDDATTALFL